MMLGFSRIRRTVKLSDVRGLAPGARKAVRFLICRKYGRSYGEELTREVEASI